MAREIFTDRAWETRKKCSLCDRLVSQSALVWDVQNCSNDDVLRMLQLHKAYESRVPLILAPESVHLSEVDQIAQRRTAANPTVQVYSKAGTPKALDAYEAR